MVDRIIYVLRACRKPSTEELARDFKIIVVGVIVIGAIGFIVHALLRSAGLR